MHSVNLALNKIKENNEKYGFSVSIDESDIKIARLAALLHDVGHYPFSHALDNIVMEENHEKYSKALVLGHFSPIIKDGAQIEPKDVAPWPEVLKTN